MTRAYEEIIDFIAAGPTPGDVASWKPSQEAKNRVVELIRREKRKGLADAETAELNRYMELEHMMRLAKARARKAHHE